MSAPTARRARLGSLAFWTAVALLAVWLLPRGWLSDGSARDDRPTLERIRDRGVVRVGYANEAPFAYMDSATGRLTGEAPEIARIVFGLLGVPRIEGVLTEFGALIPGLQAGRFDVIAAGMYITPPRCREVAFSNPTYGIGEAFLVQAGNPLDLHSYEDVVVHSEARLGVVSGAIQLNYARALQLPSERLVVLPDPPSALAAVEAGRIDAYAGTALTVQDLLARGASDRVERAEPFSDPVIDGASVRGFGAFAMRHEDRALVELVNEQLAGFIGTDSHLRLVEPFGFTASELPGALSAADLCAGTETPDD